MESLAKSKILSVNVNDITKSFIEELFAGYHDKETNQFKQANFTTTEEITLTQKEYKWVKGTIKTTIGKLLFNRFVLEQPNIIEHTGYWDTTIDKKGLSKLTVAINNLALHDKITIEQLGDFIDLRDCLGFWCASFLSVSITPSLIRPMENVEKRKAELFKQYEKEIKSDNPVRQTMTVNKIEKELMDMVRENLKSDSGYDLYRSGDGNLDNNYKTINVMRGAVFNNITKKYDIVENSLMNGVKKENITAFANSIVAGAYPSAVGTAEAGYLAKIIMAILQSEHIDPDPKSDCGTKSTIPVTITNGNKQYFLFRNIDVNGKVVLMTLDNISEYVGKTVNMYSPQCCSKDAICSKCAGQIFHMLGVKNVGLLVTQITQKLLNLKLKSKHDLSQNAGIIPENYVFLNSDTKYYSVENGLLKNKFKMRLFIPRLLEELQGFVRESTNITCMGIFPVKFYDKDDHEVFSTLMTVPTELCFNVYNDIQEDVSSYIVTYEIDSDICFLEMQKSVKNVEFFINQIYIYSKSPQMPYNLLTEMMFRCLEINSIDLTGPSIAYELLARSLCRYGDYSFAKVYSKNPNIDQMSYRKLWFREAVHEAGALQAILFQDISAGMNKGLSQTLDGKKPTYTPLEQIIRA